MSLLANDLCYANFVTCSHKVHPQENNAYSLKANTAEYSGYLRKKRDKKIF